MGRYKREVTPGPGAYEPHTVVTEPVALGGRIARTGRDSRHVNDFVQAHIGSETEVGVGPGTFEPRMLKDGQGATMAEVAGERAREGWGWSFFSDSLRNMFSFLLPEEYGTAHSF